MRQFFSGLAVVTDHLAHAALWAGMILPPWNLFWWIVGYLLFFVLPDPKHGGSWQLAGLALPGLVVASPFFLLGAALRWAASRV